MSQGPTSSDVPSPQAAAPKQGPSRLRPGWKIDPEEPGRYRYWNGEGWTQWLSTDPDAGTPPAEGLVVMRPEVTRRDKIMRAIFAVVAFAVVSTLAISLIGASMNRKNEGLPAGWQTTPTPAPTVTGPGYLSVKMNTTTGESTIGNLSATLPARPFALVNPDAAKGLFESYIASDGTPLHKGRPGLPGGVFFGIVDQGMAMSGTEELSSAIFCKLFAQRIASNFKQVEVSDPVTKKSDIVAPQAAAESRLEFTYALEDGKKASMQVGCYLIDVGDSQWAAMTTMVNDQIDPVAKAAIEKTPQTLKFAGR